MFEDIIKERKITWNRNCGNCEYSSTILSTNLPMLFCRKRESHVDKYFYCEVDYYGKYSVNLEFSLTQLKSADILEKICQERKNMENSNKLEMLENGPCIHNIWEHFWKLPPMTGEEIAQEIGQTRANVSRILKKIFGNTYNMVHTWEPELSPFEIAIHMAKIFGVDFSLETEVKKFFRLFPLDIKELIEKDGNNRMENGKRRMAIVC